MSIEFTFKNPSSNDADTAIVCVYKDNALSLEAEKLDKEHDQTISHFLDKQKKFKGKAGEMLSISAPKESPYTRFIVLGLGDPEKLNLSICETAGGKLYLALKAAGSRTAALFIDDYKESALSAAITGAHIAMGVKLRSYKFEKYRADNEDETGHELEEFTTITTSQKEATEAFDILENISEGMFLARDLFNEPPNHL